MLVQYPPPPEPEPEKHPFYSCETENTIATAPAIPFVVVEDETTSMVVLAASKKRKQFSSRLAWLLEATNQ